ncbi:bone morphogenetic protein 3-like [Watersipora subatra]|uniref:bone morphogenetic protein 3-like n=1 Tax=Watersipora subatra TaxID=2589382 RepID=UPI00355B370E
MEITWIILATCYVAALTYGEDDVPRKMKQLYKQYRRHGVQGEANTIRYIPAYKGSQASGNKLIFNLDALQKKNETFVGAELYFYRRSLEAMVSLQIDSFEVSPYYVSLVERLRLNPAGKGWQQINLTDTVRRCTNTIKTNNKLAVAFSDVKSDFVSVPVDMHLFVKHHELPFLLLYSHNTRTLEMDQITDHTKLSKEDMTDELNSMVNPESGKLTLRKRRNVLDNRIDELSDALLREIDTEDKYNEMTNKVEVEKSAFKDVPTEPTMSHDDISNSESISQPKVQYLPWPKFYNKRKRGKSRKNKLLSQKKVENTNSDDSETCGRRPLRINLEDIGWGSQVIEPRKIDAYYCSGTCIFPFTYGKDLTNHATLQSLLTAVEPSSKVPQLCCVPQQLQSVTLLYYDADQNIVLKTYPDMSVESCVCR